MTLDVIGCDYWMNFGDFVDVINILVAMGIVIYTLMLARLFRGGLMQKAFIIFSVAALSFTVAAIIAFTHNWQIVAFFQILSSILLLIGFSTLYATWKKIGAK